MKYLDSLMMLVGKFVVAYVPSCREKEYYIACACEEIYAPPSAYFSLFGLTVQAGFVRGTLTLLFIASF
jgi:protease-4